MSRSSHRAVHLLPELCSLQLAQAYEPGYVVFVFCGYVSIGSGLHSYGNRGRIWPIVAVQDEPAYEPKTLEF